MKKSFYLLLFSFVLLGGPCALGQTTYYLKNNGDYVKHKDSADFIRIVQPREGDMGLFPVKELYLNGAIKCTAQSYRKDSPVYQGDFNAYFENGIKKQYSKYLSGFIVDTSFFYYPNGKLYQLLRHPKFADSSLAYVETVNDTSGTAIVQNGNGKSIIYDADFKYVTAQGNIKDGKYDGEWTGEIRSDVKLRYKETYKEGILQSGESVDEQGKVYQYTESDVKPTFEGGIRNFYIHVMRNLRYPNHLVSRRISGVAHVSFVVLPNGKVSDAHVINDVHHAIAAEAVSVIKSAKGWIPGRRKGKPVNMTLVIPITFNIGF